MCGIFGLTLDKQMESNVSEIIVKGLKNLEYRGYDSVGLAVITREGKLVVKKGKGTLISVSTKKNFRALKGWNGIGHTRWATHGAPTDENAHPHTDCTNNIAVVHNGIIKNYMDIKKKLLNEGHIFKSETDTEVIPHLIEKFHKETRSIEKAFTKTVKLLHGSFAIAMATSHAKEKIFFAKKESPLIIGIMKNGMILASDIPAILEYTNKILVVLEEEHGWINPRQVYLEKNDYPTYTPRRITLVEWKADMARKAGYPHFMIKEIHEQPIALKNTFDGILSDENLLKAVELINNAKRVFLTAAGTSYHAGLITKYFIENLAGRIVYPFISSEYKTIKKNVGEEDVLIAVSQSGETIDTLKALRTFKEKGGETIAITNVLGSAINREAHRTVTMRAGPEIGVAATKTFLTQVLTGELLAVQLGELTGELTVNEAENLRGILSNSSKAAAESISIAEKDARTLSTKMAEKTNAYFLGRGLGVPLSFEGALKMKEISYIHSEAYPAGESKHGPIAIVEKDYPVIFIVTSDSWMEIKNNIDEMNARQAYTVSIAPKKYFGNLDSKKTIMVPTTHLILQPFVLTPPFQLLSYYTATRLGYNPDKPRNLAKTVTVE